MNAAERAVFAAKSVFTIVQDEEASEEVASAAPTNIVGKVSPVRPLPEESARRRGRPIKTPEIEEQVQLLVLYFSAMSDGEELSWMRIETDTGIPMTLKKRDLVRRALKRLGWPPESMRGYGIKLSSPETALRIVRRGLVRIDNSIRNLDRTQKQLITRHIDKMSSGDQQKMISSASCLNACRASVRQMNKKALGE